MDDAVLQSVPIDRLLPETDFPARQVHAYLPAAVAPLEQRLMRLWGLSAVEVRHQLWANLKTIAIASGAIEMISDEFATRLLAV
jgi:TatD DNase family protein